MKNKIMMALLLPVLSFSYELDFNKSFSKVVNPDLLTTSVNINIEKKMKLKLILRLKSLMILLKKVQK